MRTVNLLRITKSSPYTKSCKHVFCLVPSLMGNPSKYGYGVDNIKLSEKFYDIINCISFLMFLFPFWCCAVSSATCLSKGTSLTSVVLPLFNVARTSDPHDTNIGLLLIVRISFARVCVTMSCVFCVCL
jgi:hypothetical protein